MSTYQVPTEQEKAAQLVRVVQRRIDAGAGYLTPAEVYEFLRFSRTRVHMLVTEGKFARPLKQGQHQLSRIIWPGAALHAWIEAQREEAPNASV
jgi:hypothetical protein